MLKREDISFISVLFVICLLGSVIVSLICKNTDVDKQTVVWIWAGPFIIVGWLVAIPMLMHKVNLQCKAGNQLVDNIIWTFITQEVIDAGLHRLALPYIEVCQDQVALQGVETAEQNLAASQTRITEAKNTFWTAHQLARGMKKFITWGSVKSYRTNPPRPVDGDKPAKAF